MIKFYYWRLVILLGIIILNLLLAYFLSKRTESFTNKQYKYGILICCHNRPEFLKKTLESLKKTNKEDLNQSILYIIDDCSDDNETTKMIEEYDIKSLEGVNDLEFKMIRNMKNMGIAKSLEKGGNENVTTKELSNLNHLFQECKTGSPSEYATIEQTFSPIALEETSNWILKQIK